MALLTVHSVAKQFNAEQLFTDLTFSVFEKDRLALIGPNGSGKSTILKIMSGLLEPDQGYVTSVAATEVSYIGQMDSFSPGETIASYLLSKSELDDLADLSGNSLKVIGSAGFSNFEIEVDSLSGGWKKRLSLSAGISKPADIYILDEPTNHLDIEGVWWLEQIISRHPASFVVCSHDRYFIERIASRTMELNSIYEGGFYEATGAYENFIQRRHEYILAESKRQSKLKNILRREEEWLSRMPKARGTKSRARIQAAGELQSELASVQNRAKTNKVDIEFTGTGKRSRRLIELEDVQKSFESKNVLKNASLVVRPGQRIGILGVNGSGKSTLLKIINGSIEIDSGQLKAVQGLSIAYFDQARTLIDDSVSLRRTLAPDSDSVLYNGSTVHVSSWARRFGFDQDVLDTPIGNLSGGEKARVFIAFLMLQDADVLLLDEPTNDLDIETLEILENALQESERTVILVSHDRYFLNAVCTEWYGLLEGELTRFGGVAQWEQAHQSIKKIGIDPDKKKEKKSGSGVKGLSYNEKREYKTIEKRIEKAEKKVSEYENLLSSSEVISDPERLKEQSINLSQAISEVESLYQRWEELENKKNS